jgi:hypothetical protein
MIVGVVDNLIRRIIVYPEVEKVHFMLAGMSEEHLVSFNGLLIWFGFVPKVIDMF